MSIQYFKFLEPSRVEDALYLSPRTFTFNYFWAPWAIFFVGIIDFTEESLSLKQLCWVYLALNWASLSLVTGFRPPYSSIRSMFSEIVLVIYIVCNELNPTWFINDVNYLILKRDYIWTFTMRITLTVCFS